MRITIRLQVKIMKKLLCDIIAIGLSLSLFVTSQTFTSFAFTADSGFCDIDLSSEEFSFGMGDIDIESFNMPSGISFNSSASTLSDAYLYGDSLDQNNKSVYEALRTWVNPSLNPVSITFPEAVTVSLSALPGGNNYSDSDKNILQGRQRYRFIRLSRNLLARYGQYVC